MVLLTMHRRGGASGNKLKMTLGLPVYDQPFLRHHHLHLLLLLLLLFLPRLIFQISSPVVPTQCTLAIFTTAIITLKTRS